MNIILSIIMPFYNSKLYFPKTIESLLGQLSDKVEVVFVNDGSTDDSEKCIELLTMRPNIKYISIKHNGVSAARNEGVRQCCGKYIWYMDSDDLFCEGIIEKIVKTIIEYDYLPDLILGKLLTRNDEKNGEIYQVRFNYQNYLGRVNCFDDPFDILLGKTGWCTMLGNWIF